MKRNEVLTEWLEARGFDKGTRGCSQCEALSINVVPCHEEGCLHAVHECRGCDELVPMTVRYCEGCRS